MFKLIAIGVLPGLFFSTACVLNLLNSLGAWSFYLDSAGRVVWGGSGGFLAHHLVHQQFIKLAARHQYAHGDNEWPDKFFPAIEHGVSG